MTAAADETGPSRADADAIERLLGGPETAWLVGRVRERILDAGGEQMRGVVRRRDPSDAERAAAVRLVGMPRRQGQTLSVDLAAVERILRRGPWPAGLADAVQALTGPVIDHRGERERERAAWTAARDRLIVETPQFAGLAPWWESWCAAGGLTRIARAEARRIGSSGPEAGERLVQAVADLLRLLPAKGEPLSMIARRAVGDAHALDADRPLGRLALAVVWAAFGTDAARPSSREVWQAAGVERSALASTVLCLGVGGRDDVPRERTGAATASMLEAMRTARAPVILTLEQVRSGGARVLPPEGVVHVCENPTVVEVAADRWSRAAADVDPVLVCTSGQPSFAVIELLDQLTASGAECRYHGDFDWPGLRIAAALGMRVPWVAWRFGAADYRAAAATEEASLELAGRPSESPWDVGLAAAMVEIGRAVEEEAVLDGLVDDLVQERRSTG
ncbi:TIGR02679 family protein [Microbacterium sp. LRZ72]|uniref:TIGR02679 family protein n=1 Tax=Microbacterium sp. LRZ72 TaxID=2942481 RepID=UPI0029AC57F7|nr:TIGR02679 family protein [Microbacterium sp. LRZ72]MDX2377874.1 TIGR02679 family protein [Microbacterium sp. LRZ72]